MDLATSIPVVTGSNRGLGRHLVDALLDRGARKVYALARDPTEVRHDPRCVPIAFDLLDHESIDQAARTAADATLLINNASTAVIAGVLEADPAGVRLEIDTNFLGLYATIRAFVPVIEANGGGQIVNVLSMLSLASSPWMAGYSASKAAAHSLTQALRPVLAARGITVHAVYPSTMDTDMVAEIDLPKNPPADVAAGILDGIVRDQEDILPDTGAQAGYDTWRRDPKGFARALAGASVA
jgi:NAD(P)-dependent dehydrogenase (short-subunit alcohol dehydrogenase family)